MVSEGVPLLDVQMQVLNNSLALAEAGQADLGASAEGLTKIMNAYRFTMGSIEEVNERAAWSSDVMNLSVEMGMGSLGGVYFRDGPALGHGGGTRHRS
jgi:hypothetical protein